MKNYKELSNDELEQVSGGLSNNPSYYGCNTGDFTPTNALYTGKPICSCCKHFKSGACEKGHDNPIYGLSSADPKKF